MPPLDRAWTIDEVVKDVYETRRKEDGSEEQVITGESLVHIGPYADVRLPSANRLRNQFLRYNWS